MFSFGSYRMITLYGFGPGFGLPEISPFVTKTEVQLKMAGLTYRKERAMPPASPKGQLPFIDDAGEVVADSTFIRAHVERKYGFDFDAGLDQKSRAQAWAFERMIETMSTGRWSGRAGSSQRISPRDRRISSTVRRKTAARS